MRASSVSATPKRFRYSLRGMLIAVFLLAVLLMIGNQERRIHELHRELRQLESDHQRLSKDHRDLKALVRNPPVRIDPLIARLP